ncbi:MAG: DPP IV N-terminal domain-containing protein, partial [Frankia sp.]
SGPPVDRADRHERRYEEQEQRKSRTPVLIAVIAVAVVIVLGVIIASIAGAFAGSTSNNKRNLGAGSSPAAPGFVLPKSATGVSDDTLVYGSQEPDHGTILARSNVVTINKDGTATRLIVSGLAQGQNLLPVFSPDRRTMVYYVPSNGSLVAKAADGSGDRIRIFTTGQIASLKLAPDARPSFSPDGKKIAIFALSPQNVLGLYVVTVADGSVKKLATPANRPAADPAFSPDGKLVAFWAKNPGDPNGNGGRLFTSNADGTGTPNEVFAGNNADPSWSPDGNFIVFTSEATDRATGKVNRDIDIVRKDGDEHTRLTTDPATDQDPVFSPDGKQIAFSSDRSATRQIFTMNVDGSAQTQVTHDGFKDGAPGWFWH